MMPSSLYRPFILGLGLCLGTGQLSAAEQRFSSGPSRARLIELYTSEGCSSCPPAEKWLDGLRDDPGLWREFVPVAFHVTYWDNLGWLDRFAAPAFTHRQYAYASAWDSSTVYTPCFVRDGAEWRPADSRPGSSNENPGVLTVVLLADGKCRVEFAPADHTASARPLEAHIALLGGGLASRVTAGENSGRVLTHEFVVLGVADALMNPDEGVVAAEANLPRPTESDIPRRALAVWVTRGNDLPPLQATGGWLR
jgi:hypothetical protein